MSDQIDRISIQNSGSELQAKPNPFSKWVNLYNPHSLRVGSGLVRLTHLVPHKRTGKNEST